MKMFAAKITVVLIALCAFCTGVFAEDKAQVSYEQGRAAVAYTRTKSRSIVIQPVVVQPKDHVKTVAAPTITKSESCTSGSCTTTTSSVATTETYQYKRSSPFRRSGGGLFSRSRGSCSSGSCGG